MARPRLPLDTRDWLDNKELRRCGTTARSVLIDMMCLASEGVPYGHLADKSGPIAVEVLAGRFNVPMRSLTPAIEELLQHARILRSEELGTMYVPRMVRDEEIRLKRAAGGKTSLVHPNVQRPKALADAEERKKKVTEVIVAGIEHLQQQGSLPGTGGPTEVNTDTSGEEFTAWWKLWSSVRGTPRQGPACQAWLSVVHNYDVKACMECTASYLDSLDNPSRGFHPDNFLFEQAKQQFSARWPPNRRRPQVRDSGAEIADLARQRWDEDGHL